MDWSMVVADAVESVPVADRGLQVTEIRNGRGSVEGCSERGEGGPGLCLALDDVAVDVAVVDTMVGLLVSGVGVLPHGVAPDEQGRVSVPAVEPDRTVESVFVWDVTPELRLMTAFSGHVWFDADSGVARRSDQLAAAECWRLAGALSCAVALHRVIDRAHGRGVPRGLWDALVWRVEQAVALGREASAEAAVPALEALFGPTSAEHVWVWDGQWDQGTLVVTIDAEGVHWDATGEGPDVVRLHVQEECVDVDDLKRLREALLSGPGVLPEGVTVDERQCVRVEPLPPEVDEPQLRWRAAVGAWVVHDDRQEVYLSLDAALREGGLELAPRGVWRLARVLTSVVLWQEALESEFARAAQELRSELGGGVSQDGEVE